MDSLSRLWAGTFRVTSHRGLPPVPLKNAIAMSKSADGFGSAGITATRLVAAVIVLQGIATIVLHGTWHEPLFSGRTESLVQKPPKTREQLTFAHDTTARVRPPETKTAPIVLPTKRNVEMNPAPITERKAGTRSELPKKRQAVATRKPQVKRNPPVREPARNQSPPVKKVWIPPDRPVRSLSLCAG